MASSMSEIKKFPGLSQCPKGLSVTKFGLTRKSPRCAQCLKFKADDPAKFGEDEFGELLCCSKCKKVNYCSKFCAEKNFPFHNYYCEHGICPGEIKEFSLPLMIYATAVMGEDARLCEEFLDFAANKIHVFGIKTMKWASQGSFAERDRILNKEMNKNMQPNTNLLCNVILLFLGRDQEAYEFLKYSLSDFEKVANYELFLKRKSIIERMPKKYRNPSRCKEKFFAMDFFKKLLITTQKSMQSPLLLVPYWLILAIIKINVIEEMKHNFNKMQNYFQKWDRKKFNISENKFKNSPMILEGLAILHLGNDDTIGCSKVYCDEESYLMELNDQKEQLKKLLNLMVKNFQGRKDMSAIWLAIEGDCREHFINSCQTKSDCSCKYVALDPIFALIKYFNKHPSASKIILASMERNKTGDKVEKNFYVNLMGLPCQKHPYF